MKLMRNVSKLSHTLSKYKHKFATIQIHSTLVRIIPRFWTVNCRCFAMRCLSCVHTDSTGTRHPLPDMRTQLIYATRYQISEHKLYTTHVARCQLTIDIQPRCQMSANNWYTPPPRCQMSGHKWYTTPIARFQIIHDIYPHHVARCQNTTDIYHSLPVLHGSICDIMSPG